MREKCTEITFISYNEAKEKSCIWQNENESPVNSFLIDQSLSKAKGEGGKKTNTPEMLIWNRHFREQIRLSNYHLCLQMTPLM